MGDARSRTLVLGAGLAVVLVAFSAGPARASIVFDAVTPFSGTGCDPCNLYMNGVSLVPTAENNTTFTMEAENAAGTIRLGNKVTTCCFNADGIMDEFTVYGSGPTRIAYGGLTGDSTEQLADPGSNFTFGFNLVDNPGTTRRGEYAYFGSDSPFRGLNVMLATLGVGTVDLKWEYWNGTAWGDLEAVGGFTDDTGHFTSAGTVFWTSEPGTWSPYSIDGSPDLYYVRAHLTSGAYTTSPQERAIKTDILLFQYCGDIVAAAQTFDFDPFVPTAVDLMSFSAVGVPAAVDLTWRTGSELDNLGFHLHRSRSQAGPWARLTRSLIPGRGSSPEGASYSFLDTDTSLRPGVAYFYRLEDVDARSRSTFHGPVSAVPRAPAPVEPTNPGPEGSPGSGGSTRGPTPTAETAAPDPPPPPPGCPTCAQGHGDPGEASFRVLSRSASGMTVELRTPGFVATPDTVGVRVSVAGFDEPSDPAAPALPLKRALLDGIVGRSARVVSVEAGDVLSFSNLTPAAVGESLMDVAADGTVRPRRSSSALDTSSGAILPTEPVVVTSSVFLGETKKLSLEMNPLRYDTATGELLLARTLVAEIAFDGAPTALETGFGSRGRRAPRSVRRSSPDVLASLHTTEVGLYSVSFDSLFPARQRPIPVSSLRLSREGEAVPFHVEPSSRVAPNYDALAEAFLKVEGRGTIAAFSPSGLSLDGPAHQFHRALVNEITSGKHERLGDAVLAAQAAYAGTGLMPELLGIYRFLGDPGMRIR